MPDILHELIVSAPPQRVFEMFTTAEGLSKWWTKRALGNVSPDEPVRLFFGAVYDWQARITRFTPPVSFELEITEAHPDWVGTLVGCELSPTGEKTRIRFHHLGWREPNEHWRVSCFCWAMYLRLLKRHLEHGETVEYEKRLDA